ncbi:unnamed protein product [Penicillium salamii]|nr:unnamed protein product [Penicillium salamii]CAG8353945.1 unnamed protein product [Penicillium salamii]
MAFVHKELCKSLDTNQGFRLEFFFTARGTELQRTSLGMIRSLLVQILKSNTTAYSELHQAYLERCRDFDRSNWEWPQRPLEKLFQHTILKLATQQQIIIFVDALDKARSDTARRLADYFHQLNHDAAKNAAKIKICISYRHYPIVGKSTARKITVKAHNEENITTYIKHHLDDIVATDSPHQEE